MTSPTRQSFSVIDGQLVQHAFDATSLDAADKCLRYYDLSIRQGWQHPEGSVHFWFGGIYAKALETFHKLQASGSDREDAIRSVVRLALIESWDHDLDPSGARIPATGQARSYNHNLKNRETLIRTIVWYFEEFKDEAYSTYIRQDGTPAVEASFQLPVDNGITLCGHIDRVAVDEQGNPYVHDQKTTGTTLSPYFFKGYKPSVQFSLYTFAGKIVYNIPVKGVIVDAAQVAVGFSRFGRAPVLFTEGELNEWYDETLTLAATIQAASRANHFPKRPASCGNYGGCTFREICSRPPEVRENFLRADFVQRKEPWDPIKPR